MLRVLHAPLNIGGHVLSLVDAERRAGIDSCLLLSQTADNASHIPHADYIETVDFGKLPVPRTVRAKRKLLSELIDRFDIFHFNFGRSLVDFTYFPCSELLDLPVLKSAGKGIVFTYQGCDARDKWDHFRSNRVNACVDCTVAFCGIKSILRRNRLSRVQRYADHIFIVNPDLKRRLPNAEFLPYAVDDIAETESIEPCGRAGVVRVVHAPTDRSIKGTKYVISAVSRLREKGLKVELDLVERVSRSEAYARYKQADIVVDQVLIGWYGSLGVEASWLGKPVVCYIDNPAAAGVVPDAMLDELPIQSATPENLVNVLERLVLDDNMRSRHGMLARQYAERWHKPARVAERVAQLYQQLSYGGY